MTTPPCSPMPLTDAAPTMAEAPDSRPNRAELIDALVQAETALLIAGSDLGISGVARLPLLEQAHRLNAFLGRVGVEHYGDNRLAANQKLAAKRFRETRTAGAWATTPEA